MSSINYPAASSGVLEQRQLTVFMQLLVFAALLSDVVAYRVLVSMFADGGRKITIWAKITARAAARGRFAHHKRKVLGCPGRMDFSRALALLMASSGRATSMSFFL